MEDFAQRASAVVARVTQWWSADLADTQQRLTLRARLVASAAGLGMVACTVSALGLMYQHRQGPAVKMLVPVEIFLVLGFAAAYRRGPRLGEMTYSVLVNLGYVMAAVGVFYSNGPGQVAPTALAFVVQSVMAALFIERRVLLVVSVSTAIGILVGVFAQAPTGSRPVPDLTSAAVGLVVVTVSIRLLRDLAIASIQQAQRGEVTDPLTGLVNRRGLERLGTVRWSENARLRLPIAVLVIDVDHFKQINDTEGHAHGDTVLQLLANVLTASLRAGDIAARLGGEEFLVLGTISPGHAVDVAERLHVAIERELAPVTVSIGVHEVTPTATDELPDSIWTAVATADQALYLAKSSGRNRVVDTGSLQSG